MDTNNTNTEGSTMTTTTTTEASTMNTDTNTQRNAMTDVNGELPPLSKMQQTLITKELKHAKKNVEKAMCALNAYKAIANQCGYSDMDVKKAAFLADYCEKFNDQTSDAGDFNMSNWGVERFVV